MNKARQLAPEEIDAAATAQAGGKCADPRNVTRRDRCDCGPTHPEAFQCREPGCPFEQAAQ
jgi:hypothetical protein